MIKAIRARAGQGYRTNQFPEEDPLLPNRYPGVPVLHQELCSSCGSCAAVCPTQAITVQNKTPRITMDLGRCIFCRQCEAACNDHAISFSGSFKMGSRTRNGLIVADQSLEEIQKIEALEEKMLKIFGRAMKIRQVSAGGCNACEADINVLETVGFDLSRFGISVTASPRHADALLITGPVSKNMELALKKTWEAMPEPKLIVAVGACAISGGIFRGMPDVCDGAEGILPIDLYIPGCPPHPMTILNGLLALLDRLPRK